MYASRPEAAINPSSSLSAICFSAVGFYCIIIAKSPHQSEWHNDIDDAQGQSDSMSSGRAGSKTGQVTGSEELSHRNGPLLLAGCGSAHAQAIAAACAGRHMTHPGVFPRSACRRSLSPALALFDLCCCMSLSAGAPSEQNLAAYTNTIAFANIASSMMAWPPQSMHTDGKHTWSSDE